jgi:protein TonB
MVTSATPLSRVFELGSRGRRTRSAVGVLTTILAHGGIAAVVFWCGDLAAWSAPLEVQEFTIDREPEKVAPPPAPPPEPPPEATPPPKPAPRAETPEDSEPAPEAAQAGALLTQEPEESEPEDSYDDTFVTGNNDFYAGGMTANLGKSLAAVYGLGARAGGTPGGAGSAAPAPQKPDRSRLPSFGTNGMWDCGFPWEADRDRIDHAIAQIRVTVKPDGTAQSVDIVFDPGHGFGRVAKSCAMKQHWDVGLDQDGHPILATTKTVVVRFNRD